MENGVIYLYSSGEEERSIHEKLTEAFTVEQVIELLDKKYGHRV